MSSSLILHPMNLLVLQNELEIYSLNSQLFSDKVNKRSNFKLISSKYLIDISTVMNIIIRSFLFPMFRSTLMRNLLLENRETMEGLIESS